MLIAGLGNKGAEYFNTRHNVGFETLNRLHKDIWLTADDYEFGTHNSNIVVKPSVGMNNSGVVVWYLQNILKIHTSDVIVIHDDMDFEPGRIKIKVGGGSGKHNGIKSIIENSDARFIRVRVGIGKPTSPKEGIDYVLGKFTKDEMVIMNASLSSAANAVNHILSDGVQSAMSVFNRKQ